MYEFFNYFQDQKSIKVAHGVHWLFLTVHSYITLIFFISNLLKLTNFQFLKTLYIFKRMEFKFIGFSLFVQQIYL